MQIILTGANGFIGSNMLPTLIKRYSSLECHDCGHTPENNLHITCVDPDYNNILEAISKVPEDPININYLHPKDIDLLKIKDEVICIHLGADSSTTQQFDSSYGNNILFTNKLVNILPKHTYFINASSASIYTPNYYRSNYTKSKIIAEEMISSYFPYSLNLRFFNVYGYDESHKVVQGMSSPVSNFIVKHLKDKCLPTCYEKVQLPSKEIVEPKRDFIHVDSITSEMLRAIDNYYNRQNINLGILQLGIGCAMSFKEMYDLCLEVTGKNYTLIKEPLKVNNSYQVHTEAQLFSNTKINKSGKKTWQDYMHHKCKMPKDVAIDYHKLHITETYKKYNGNKY